MLQVTNLQRSGLEPISFVLGPGQCLAFMGPSGAGKSLLLRALADLDPNQGDISLDGVPRAGMTAPEWRRRVGLLPAESGWWADQIGAHFADPALAQAGLEALGLPTDALEWSVARTSTGERHRLALLRLLGLHPQVLLLDEPTAALDAAATSLVETLLRLRLAAGVAIVLVTHDADQAKRLASSRLILRDGQIVEQT